MMKCSVLRFEREMKGSESNNLELLLRERRYAMNARVVLFAELKASGTGIKADTSDLSITKAESENPASV